MPFPRRCKRGHDIGLSVSVVSRNSRTPPPCPDTATSQVTILQMTMWRDGPDRFRHHQGAKAGLQRSTRNCREHTPGFRTCGVDRTRNAARAATSRRDIRRVSCWTELREYTASSSRQCSGLVVPSLTAVLLVLQAATPPSLQTRSRARHCEPRAVHPADGDQIFSYGELGFQETETSPLSRGLLRKNGFTVREGIAGIPTRGSPRGDRGSQSSRSAPTSTTFRRPRRSRAWRVTRR